MTPYSLHLESKERHAMDELAALIGTTPRTVKRFANLYRILKVRALERGEHLLDGRGPWADYEILLFLLAVSTGLPDLAPPLFQALTTARGPTVADVLTNLVGDDGDDLAQRRQLHSWFQDRQGRRWANLPAGRCKAWIVDDVRRFSFIIDAARQANGDEPHKELAPRPPATSEQPAPRGDGGTSRQEPARAADHRARRRRRPTHRRTRRAGISGPPVSVWVRAATGSWARVSGRPRGRRLSRPHWIRRRC
jgi:hypothetical protein